MKISACIITFNEEKNIADAIKSVAWADEVLVVDSESSDNTRQIAANLGAKVIIQKWPGFAKQKQFASDSAKNDWVLSLDADERVSEGLKGEIGSLDFRMAGYRIPRLSIYMGREIRHSGWYPDWQLRLFDRRKAKWKELLIHESVEVSGEIAKLKGDILHYSVEDASHHHRMIGERYAPLSARQMFENGRTTSSMGVAFAGIAAFFKSYFLRLGLLDGFPGYCIARFAAHHAFLKHLLLYEMQKKKNN